VTRQFRLPIVLVTAACFGLAVAWFREDLREAGTGEGPDRAGGHTERCLTCHIRPDESPGGAHRAEAVGCEPCHLGNPLAFDRQRAHAGMERDPGALDTVQRTCGRAGCHPREAARVATSLMATGRGLIAVDRWVFGETIAPDGQDTFADLLASRTPSPADDHLRRLCAGCHLRTRGNNRDDDVSGIGSGCGACHSTRKEPLSIRPHPPVEARVPDQQCRGCHGRSGRISLSYQGLAEIRESQAPPEGTLRLPDGRPVVQLKPDVHGEKKMACIDCHLHSDLMGDGVSYPHQEQQVTITCETCHGPVDEAGEMPFASFPDPISRDMLRLRGLARLPLDPARGGRTRILAWNLQPTGLLPPAERLRPEATGMTAPWTLTGKLDGRPHPVRQTPVDANHRLSGHQRLSCQACHSAWAPRCTTCHTRYDATGRQWDFGTGKVEEGRWIEEAQTYEFGEPTLAIRDQRVVPAIPGMIVTGDATAAGGGRFSRRLYAALDPHTTRKESRTCASCHLSSQALGLGAGILNLASDEPVFVPDHPGPDDPATASDGWVGLFPTEAAPGTRLNLRSLDATEQLRVLRVGPCLGCHPKSIDPIYLDFQGSVVKLGSPGTRCPFTPPPWVKNIFQTP
jgi:hypothetical protein